MWDFAGNFVILIRENEWLIWTAGTRINNHVWRKNRSYKKKVWPAQNLTSQQVVTSRGATFRVTWPYVSTRPALSSDSAGNRSWNSFRWDKKTRFYSWKQTSSALSNFTAKFSCFSSVVRDCDLFSRSNPIRAIIIIWRNCFVKSQVCLWQSASVCLVKHVFD